MASKHARDSLIEFDAGPHKYTCAGEGGYMSVTTWLHSHFPAFDADVIIAKMNLASPKCKYYGQTPEQIKAGWDQNRDEAAALGTAMHEAIEAYILAGLQACPTTPLLGQVETAERTQGADAENVNTVNELSVASAPCVRPLGSPSQNGGAWGVSPHFMNFIADHPHLKPYRTEWMIFDEDVKIAGSIDFVSENDDGTLTIYDWKRCK